MKLEYKVITLDGKSNFENAINEMADNRWRVADGSLVITLDPRQQVFWYSVLMYRDVVEEESV